ncbi:NUDIX hydrolase [Aquabacterium humicola]|uniref:NUDIX hydrolase n=1 Tax=Aquabacterium humicola TaxID=3237377 RepID=UPI00254312B6|nr:NUDIX hydrolase [Rubrivivax pictus]
MLKVVSCGVVLLNSQGELFLCHATGTARWDLPKGIPDPGESTLQAAVRETWEETSLALDPSTLSDLGDFDYLPAKRLHLYAAHVAVNAFRVDDCRCHTTFPHRVTGRPTLEVDAYAWKPLDDLDAWCGRNLSRVLMALDWPLIKHLPELTAVAVKPA